MKSYVSISNDISYAPTTHDIGAGVLMPCIEAPVPMFWPMGLITGVNQLTHTVFHQGLPICLAKHDLGPMIPHASIPPAPSDIKHTVGSSRKHLFSGSKCRANGKHLSACGLINMVPTPCLACADPVSLPSMGNLTMMASNGVTFGISPEDLAAGTAAIFEQIAIDIVGYVSDKAFSGLGGWAVKTAASNVKGLAVGAYKFIAEDGEAEMAISISLPWGGDLYGHSHGLKRDENGKVSLFRKDRVGEHEVSAELSLQRRPQLDLKYEKLAERQGGDVIVERDGKKYRYQGGDLPSLDRSSPRPKDWGRVTPEGDE